MFCPNCGTQIPDVATFCPNCGQHIQDAAPSTPSDQAPITPATPSVPMPVTSSIPTQVESQQASYEQVPSYGQVPTYEQPQQPSYEQVPTYGQVPTYEQPRQASYQQTSYQQSAYQQAPTYQQQAAYQQAPVPEEMIKPSIPKSFSMPSLQELFAGADKQVTAYAESCGLQMKWHTALCTVLLYLGALSTVLSAIQYLTGGVYDGSATLVYSVYPAMHVVDIIYGLFCIAYAATMLYARMLLARYSAEAPGFLLFMLIVNAASTLVMVTLTQLITGVSGSSTAIGALVGLAVGFFANRTYYSKRMHLFTR